MLVQTKSACRRLRHHLRGIGWGGFIRNPVLELGKTDGTILTNDNWRDDQE
jgi:hypothetical protein